MICFTKNFLLFELIFAANFSQIAAPCCFRNILARFALNYISFSIFFHILSMIFLNIRMFLNLMDARFIFRIKLSLLRILSTFHTFTSDFC